MTHRTITPEAVAATLAAFREAQPLVQCLTNIVVAQWTANVLLAAGAAPAMVNNVHEAGDFARVASAVLVNTGTPYPDTAEAMQVAVRAAIEAGTPWVLDPVAAGGLAWRTGLAKDFLAVGPPAILRGNASEIAGLAGGAGGRGVDSSESSEAVVEVAKALAKTHNTVVAASGAVDQITDGDRLARVANGHEIMTRVTGVGCSLGALMAGFAAVEPDGVLAAVAATALLTIAADRAHSATQLPGSFAVALLDELAAITPDELGGGGAAAMTPDLSVYLVTDTGMCGEFGVPATVAAAVRGGVTLVQVRDPDASDAEFLDLAKAVVETCRGTGVPVLLNDRVHLVAAAGADGAHVGQSDMPIAQARELLGDSAILGLTADSPAEFAAARDTGVRLDYVGIGPVYEQQTKLDIQPALGLARLAELVAACPWPAVAIGGVKAENLAAVKATGVAGGSVVSAICGQPDPEAAAAELARIWRQA